jgi:hypothetical protein
MPVVLKLDTKPTLFEPIEIEIDDVRLRVREITLGMLERIQALQLDAAAGSAAAIRENLEALLEGEVAVLQKLPLAKLAQLITVVVEKSIKPGTEEKNGSGPGAESLPS